jgi:hypothetical protein
MKSGQPLSSRLPNTRPGLLWRLTGQASAIGAKRAVSLRGRRLRRPAQASPAGRFRQPASERATLMFRPGESIPWPSALTGGLEIQLANATLMPFVARLNLSPASVECSLITTPCSFLR